MDVAPEDYTPENVLDEIRKAQEEMKAAQRHYDDAIIMAHVLGKSDAEIGAVLFIQLRSVKAYREKRRLS